METPVSDAFRFNGAQQLKNVLPIHVLIKFSNEVHGRGYQCQKEKITTNYYRNIWGKDNIVNQMREFEQLSSSDCKIMVEWKRCDHTAVIMMQFINSFLNIFEQI